MDLRSFITKAREAGYLVTISKEVDPYLEMARVINALDGHPVLFTRVKDSPIRSSPAFAPPESTLPSTWA